MLESPFLVPADITFNDALALTGSLLEKIEKGELSSDQTSSAISALVHSENGARGFFVTYLTSDGTVADNPSQAVVQALRSNPELVAELLVKNLAMSTAQAVHHYRQGNEQMAQLSKRVHERTAEFIKLVEIASVYSRCRQLLESATTGEGSYQIFLERWGYDAEQRQAICQALESVMGK